MVAFFLWFLFIDLFIFFTIRNAPAECLQNLACENEISIRGIRLSADETATSVRLMLLFIAYHKTSDTKMIRLLKMLAFHFFCHFYMKSPINMELKQRRRLMRTEFIFYQRNLRFSRSVRYTNGSKNVLKLNVQRRRSIPNGNTKNQPSSSTFRRRRKTWSYQALLFCRGR